MSSKINQAFLDMIKPILPNESEQEEFIEACTRPLKKSITINIDKISVKDFIALTKPRGRTLTPHRFTKDPITFYIDREDTTTAL
jgi:16S rRNA (cytosine1407-C5)-methyltransferase